MTTRQGATPLDYDDGDVSSDRLDHGAGEP